MCPAFALSTSETAGFCSLLYLTVYNYPDCACVQICFQFHTVSLYSVTRGGICPAASTAAKGPSPNQSQLSVGATLLPCPFCSGMGVNHTAKFH